jgi:hypothetical protein
MGEHGHESTECLMEYMVNTNLNILNGNGPAFVISNRKGVTDLALGTGNTGGLVTNWYGSSKWVTDLALGLTIQGAW